MIEVLAPAKVNLYLHVGDVRPDGLHALSSLFVFADVGDIISITPTTDAGAAVPILSISGPFTGVLEDFPLADNLVLKAARALLRYAADTEQVVHSMPRLTLEKSLPVAAGIGGGSADAAAALRGLQDFWALHIPDTDLHALAFQLGADVPSCLVGDPIFVTGAGEKIVPAPTLPPLSFCFANPKVPTPTGPIFRAFDDANPNPRAPVGMPSKNFASADAFFAGLAQTRNDLQVPAIAAVPVIGEAVTAMTDQPGCRLARMSGSGATVFGLFTDHRNAEAAADQLAARGWWTAAARLMQHTAAETGAEHPADTGA
ncbi:MAG: 4-(cytidine 5'-diphospho)-2-C-methyl-D-erythritol kinase [Pseudomonadota bacterium]